VPREERLEEGDAVGVGLLDAAEVGRVDVGGVGDAVAGGGDARVDACGVAVWRGGVRWVRFGWGGEGGGLTPDLEVDVLEGLAGGDVEDLEVEGEGDARLLLDNVLTDILARDVYPPSANAVLNPDHDRHNSQYGPSVTSGLSTHELLDAKSTSAGVASVYFSLEWCDVLRRSSRLRATPHATLSVPD